MISQSLTIWILNPLPLVGLLGMYLLIKYHHKLPPWPILALGVLSGIATGMEWMCLLTVIFLFIYLLYKSAQKTRDISIFILGFALAFSPTIIFDLRHDWYHLRTLW
jgi:uncharacterized membrane protein